MPKRTATSHRHRDRRTQADVRFSNARLLAAIEALPAGFCLYDANDRLVLFNQRYREFYPKHAESLVAGRHFEEMLRAGVERGEFAEAIGREEQWIAERLRRHADPREPIEQRLADGRWLQIEERRTGNGEIVGLRTDITHLKTLEQALKQNEERFRDFAEASADWFWEMNADLRFTYMSENVERIVGVPPEWHYGKSREDLLGDNYDRETWDRHLQSLRNREPFRNFEYLRVGEDIEPRWLRINGVPKFAEDGAFLGYRGSGTDVTEMRRAEEKLHASEIRFLHAQKMESIGRLTGGVAHDFNNLLAVIQGNLELIEEQVSGPELKSMIGAALLSVARGAKLTGQLLLIGRKALLAPAVIDLNRSVTAMGELIRRTVPATIEIETGLGEELWPVKLDQSQFEAALLNIVLNARDAMPEGGRLTIATANVDLAAGDLTRFVDGLVPGRYVMITVTDTGNGMAAEALAQAFEPFFTTKPVGQGSGLGLSMVHGFVQHSGGDVLIDSAPGQGTTVRLHFPKCRHDAVHHTPTPEQALPRAMGRKCVLVVEDQADVRRVVAAQLDSLGYQVIEAEDGASALAVLNSDQSVDILLTDMVMPGKPQGSALAEQAGILRPGIGVILTTGYPSEAAANGDGAGPERVCLIKPVSRGELAREVWKQLNDRASEQASTPPGDR